MPLVAEKWHIQALSHKFKGLENEIKKNYSNSLL